MKLNRGPRVWAIALFAALFAGAAAYILYDAPDESAIILRRQEQAIQRIRMELSSIEGLSYQFIANQDLNDSLYAFGRRPNRYDSALANLSFTRHLESQRIVSSLLEEALFLDFDEVDRIPLTMTEDFLRPEIGAVRRFVWTRAVEADGVCVWMEDAFAVHDEHYLIASRLIKRLKTGEPIGVLVLLVNARHAAEIIDAGMMEGGDPVTTGMNFVVAGNGKILTASAADTIGETAEDVFGAQSGLGAILSQGQESGRFLAVLSGRRAPAIFTRIGEKTPYLVSVYPKTVDYTVLRRIVIACFFALVVGVAILFGFRGTKATDAQQLHTDIPTGDLPPELPPLSPRERQLLLLLTKGLSNKEIAWELGIKEQTVKNYLKPLYDKLGVHDRVSALLKLRSFHKST
jgi:DNA-binding CsgD family transcriptional regulator